MQQEPHREERIFRDNRNIQEKVFPTVQSVTDLFTGAKKLLSLAAEIQHLMMLFIWQIWQNRYM